jgi:hypothetical protein
MKVFSLHFLIERRRDAIIAGQPDANEEIGLVHTALATIVKLVHTSPSINGNSVVWMKLADKAEENYEGLMELG